MSLALPHYVIRLSINAVQGHGGLEPIQRKQLDSVSYMTEEEQELQ